MNHLICFSEIGFQIVTSLLPLLGENVVGYAPSRFCREPLLPLEEPVDEWAKARFQTGNALIFVGAAGIAVRAIASSVSRKDRDPAVLCIDEQGRYVIPLLSGHMGGANRLAAEIAHMIGAQAIITTATDLRGVFAFDTWAVEQGLVVMNPEAIKWISGAMLEGKPVGIHSDCFIGGTLPPGVQEGKNGEFGVHIGLQSQPVFAHTLWLVPRCLTVGIGCRKGIDSQILERQLLDLLRHHSLPIAAVEKLASIDLKQEEPAILELAKRLGVPFITYSSGDLESVPGSFSGSEFVRETVGVDNVCERAAVRDGGALLIRKQSENGVTLAVGVQPLNLQWGDQR